MSDFGKAQWIWHPEPIAKENVYLVFRKSFELAQIPGNAVLKISAAHFYHVYINGREVGRGPDRSYYEEKYFHTYEIKSLLNQGSNVIAVRCHFLGQNLKNFSDRHAEGPAGLLAEILMADQFGINTDASWKVTSDPAYSNSTNFPSNHRFFREHYDARQAIQNWNETAFDDSNWESAECVAKAKAGPWTTLIAKATPEMTAKICEPLNMYITNSGGTKGGDFISYSAYNMISDQAIIAKDDFQIWNEHQESQEILFDLGKVMAGYPRLEINKSKGGTIKCFYGESLDLIHWDTIELGSGQMMWSPFTQRGCRYFKLVITAAQSPVHIRSVRWIDTHYPVDHRGTIETEKAKVKDIFALCRTTAETCGIEHFVDCVGREQVLWMLDFRFQALQHYYYFGDMQLAKKCFKQFKIMQLGNGHILNYGPSMESLSQLNSAQANHKPCDWLGFNFFFIIAVWEHFEYEQDTSFLNEMYTTCQRCLAYYEKNEVDGFVTSGEIESHPFVEWGYSAYSKNSKALYSFTQALYYGSLKAYQLICQRLSKNLEERRVKEKCAQLQKKFFDTFVVKGSKDIADTIVDGQLNLCKTAQPHAAVLRFFDEIPEDVKVNCLEALTNSNYKASCTGVGQALAVEALMRHSQPFEAYRKIEAYWGAMVDAHLPQTPEYYDPSQRFGADSRWSPGFSRCHAYASLAGVLLQQIVLGGKVKGKQLSIAPCFDVAEHADGAIPTMYGDVSIKWEKNQESVILNINAPSSIELDLSSLDQKYKVEVLTERFS